MITQKIMKNFGFGQILAEDLNKAEMEEQKKEIEKILREKKSLRILTHVDLDGICSAITLYKFALDKGVRPSNIVIEFGQYGDNTDILKIHSTPSGKNQAVMFTDFAKLPTSKIWNLFLKTTDFKAEKKINEIVKFCNERDFTKMSESDFISLYKRGSVVKDIVASGRWDDRAEENAKKLYEALNLYSKLVDPKTNKKPIPRITVDNIRNYRQQLINPDYVIDHHDNEDGNLRHGQNGVIGVECPSNAGLLARMFGKWSSEDIAAIDMIDSAGYKEDELIDTIKLNGMADTTDSKALAIRINAFIEQATKKDKDAAIKIIRNSDTSLASVYKNLMKELNTNDIKMRLKKALEKKVSYNKDGTPKTEFKTDKATGKKIPKKSKDEEIRDLINSLDDDEKVNFQKKPKLKKRLVKTENGYEEKLVDITKHNGVDRKLFDPDSHYYKNRNGDSISRMSGEDEIRDKNRETVEDTKSGYLSKKQKARLEELANKMTLTSQEAIEKDDLSSRKSNIFGHGAFAILVARTQAQMNKYPSRYTPSLFTVNGQRFPFSIKVYNNFIQAAKNPLYKGKVNFANVAREVYNDVENFIKSIPSSKMSEWVKTQFLDDMHYDSGGHGAIFSLQGFEQIKMTGNLKKNYFELKDFIDRADKVFYKKRTDTKDIKQEKDEKRERIARDKMDKFEKLKNTDIKAIEDMKEKIINFAISSTIKHTLQLYPLDPIAMKDLQTSNTDFEGK